MLDVASVLHCAMALTHNSYVFYAAAAAAVAAVAAVAVAAPAASHSDGQ
jgi:hypothetical protein